MSDALSRAEFENAQPRCACVLLLDTSSSMRGEAIAQLNAGLRTFKDATSTPPASLRVDVAVVTFDDRVEVVQDFVIVEDFEPPTLTAQGLTSMGTAMTKALEMVQDRKAVYRANGIDYYRPWVLLITDGRPEGEPASAFVDAARRVRDDERQKKVAVFAVGVDRADMARLSDLVERTPVLLNGLDFRSLFVWLSRSMQSLSQAETNDADQVALPAVGWGKVAL